MRRKSGGRHYESINSKSLNKKKIVSLIFLLILIFVFLLIFIPENKGNIDNQDNINTIQNIENNTVPTNEMRKVEIVDIDMPDKIENYSILGQIVIEKGNIERYILNETNNYSLNLSVTKFYGADLNQIGNCCITGHNMEGHFKELKHLKKGDTFYIIDKKNSEKVTYEIYDMYTVAPTNLDCLNQETNNTREVTLITCNPRWTN